MYLTSLWSALKVYYWSCLNISGSVVFVRLGYCLNIHSWELRDLHVFNVLDMLYMFMVLNGSCLALRPVAFDLIISSYKYHSYI